MKPLTAAVVLISEEFVARGDEPNNRHTGQRGKGPRRAGVPHSRWLKKEKLMSIELKEWAIPIRFEGVSLSPLSIAIDHLGKRENLPNISEEASLWLWQFTICRGRSRTDGSEKIQGIVTEVMQLVNNDQEQLIKSVARNFDGPFTEDHLKLWIEDLKMIRTLSQGKEQCTWECD